MPQNGRHLPSFHWFGVGLLADLVLSFVAPFALRLALGGLALTQIGLHVVGSGF
jgi:hypothetical protein